MRRTDHGFTLLEVLVAMAVLAAVLPAIMIAFSTGARTRAASENGTTAAYLVRDKFSELEAVGVPEEGEDSGDFGEGSRFTWTTTVGSTETEELYDVVVRVQWLEMGQQREFAVRTYMAGQSNPEGGGAGQGGQGPGGPGR